MNVLGLAAGVTIAAGVLLIATGWRRRQVRPSGTARHRVEVPVERLVAVVIAALAVLLLTRWLVAALGAAAGAWFAVGWWQARSAQSDEQRAEAVALWIEMLRDVSGTARGLEGVLAVTAPGAPQPIRPQVMRMAEQLRQGVALDQALAEGAVELDHPVADLAITTLRLTAQAGGGRLREVLDDLAEVAHGEADVHRRLEVARSKPRAQMRYVAMAIAAAVVLLTATFRDYLAPYETAQGQLVLAVIGAAWVAAFVWMERLGRLQQPQRYMRSPEP